MLSWNCWCCNTLIIRPRRQNVPRILFSMQQHVHILLLQIQMLSTNSVASSQPKSIKNTKCILQFTIVIPTTRRKRHALTIPLPLVVHVLHCIVFFYAVAVVQPNCLEDNGEACFSSSFCRFIATWSGNDDNCEAAVHTAMGLHTVHCTQP